MTTTTIGAASGPRAVIPAPPAVPPALSLLTAALGQVPPADAGDVVTDANGQTIRWENGFAYAPENCGTGGVVAACGDSGGKAIPPNLAIVDFVPYGVWAGDRCSAFGFEARDYQGRARRLLLAAEAKQMEHELWTGTLAQAEGWPNAFLTDGNAETVTGAPATPLDALACLEQALASCGFGPRGMIHASPHVVQYWFAQNNILRREGNRIYTNVNDNIVVPGSGYDGSGPAGEPVAGGAVWAYATTPVRVLRGPIQVVPGSYNEALEASRAAAFAEATERSQNTIEFRAERLAAATWDGCCQFAAEINLTLCVTGS